MQIPTATEWTNVGDPYGRVRGKIEGPEYDGNQAGRPTVSSNPVSWKLPENELLIKEHTWTGVRPLAHMPQRDAEKIPNLADYASPGWGNTQGRQMRVGMRRGTLRCRTRRGDSIWDVSAIHKHSRILLSCSKSKIC